MKRLILISIFALLISACKKDSPEMDNTKYGDIIAGDVNQNFFISYNDTITADYNGADSLPLDINNDYISDIILYSNFNFYFGGLLTRYWSTIRSTNNTEILTDTSQKEFIIYGHTQFFSSGVETYDTIHDFKNKISPRILDMGDAIKNNGFWITDTLMYLCSETPSWSTYNDSIVRLETEYFHGWNALDNKFLGYRYFSESDTIYGWLKFKIENFNKISVYQTSHE